MADSSDAKLHASLNRLDQLAPEARQRVQDALKGYIEAEVGSGGVDPGRLAEFSRGIIFSRSRPSSMLRDELELVRQAANLDEASFAKFARNLSQLKGSKSAGG